jgi:hypothetical protein
LAGLSILLAVTLVNLPAAWLDAALQRHSHGSLALTSASGTLWKGQGVLQAILPGAGVVDLDEVDWRVDPSAVLGGEARVLIRRLKDGVLILDARANWRGWTLARVDLNFPAGLLGGFSSTFARLGLNGAMRLNLNDLAHGQSGFSGGGELIWRGAGAEVARGQVLGDYRLAVVGAGSSLNYRLSSDGGDLRLDGQGSWRPELAPSFTGHAQVAPESRERLAPLLRMIGKETGPGAYTLVLDANAGLGVR